MSISQTFYVRRKRATFTPYILASFFSIWRTHSKKLKKHTSGLFFLIWYRKEEEYYMISNVWFLIREVFLNVLEWNVLHHSRSKCQKIAVASNQKYGQGNNCFIFGCNNHFYDVVIKNPTIFSKYQIAFRATNRGKSSPFL